MMDAWEEQINHRPDDRLPVGGAVEAKVLAQRFGYSCGAVAESLGRCDGVLGQGRQAM
jgi:hypothetical protein